MVPQSMQTDFRVRNGREWSLVSHSLAGVADPHTRGAEVAVRQRLQHGAGADAQEIRDEARELDLRFLDERFQTILQLNADCP